MIQSLVLGKKPEIPTREATAPPIKSQTVLLVGEPVKKRDTSEPMELDALIPYTINIVPITKRLIDTTLFMVALPRYRIVSRYEVRLGLAPFVNISTS